MRGITEFAGSVVLGSALAAFGAVPSFAASCSAITLQCANNDGGSNQSYNGVGLEFTVNSPITIGAIGIYDSGEDGITGPLTADLINVSTELVVSGGSVTFTNTSPGTVSGGYFFQSITPITLAAGGSYYLMGYGWNGVDAEHNSIFGGNPDTFNTFGGAVTYVTSAWTATGIDPAGTVPTQFSTAYAGNPNFFSSANIELTSTPLPSTWTMLIAGFLGLGYFAYRGRRKTLLIR